MKTISVLPAYGRKYQSEEAALADWNEGKDFKIPFGPYLSIGELEYLKADKFTQVRIIWNTTEDLVSSIEVPI